MSDKVEWYDPTPNNSCPVCVFHRGSIFEITNALPLPAHFECECFYRPLLEEKPVTSLDIKTAPDNIKKNWTYKIAEMLRNEQADRIPSLLQPLIPDAEEHNRKREDKNMPKKNTVTLSEPLTLAATNKPREYYGRIIKAGRIRNAINEPGHFVVEPEALETAVANSMFNGLACFVDHSHWSTNSLKNLFGSWHTITYNPHEKAVYGTLRYYESDATRPIAELFDQILADAQEGLPIPDVGVSIVFYPIWTDADNGPKLLTGFKKIESADLVFTPAADGRIVEALSALQKENPMTEETAVTLQPAAATPDPAPWLAKLTNVTVTATLRHSDLPRPTQERLSAQNYNSPEELDAAIAQARTELAALAEAGIIQLPGNAPRNDGRITGMVEPMERIQNHVDWFFGVEAATPPPWNYRRLDSLYVELTGDTSFTGQFDSQRAHLSASPVTLPNMALNALNKVMVEQFSKLPFWRWYELVTVVTPNDGSLHNMVWVTYGGSGNLPIVEDGGAYTEGELADAKETSVFSKYGRFIGITRKMLKNSDIARVQAVSRGLAIDSIRTRSASIASIGTANSGQGPTMSDGNPAFKSDNINSNYATTALGSDTTAWQTASAECFNHTELGSGKKIATFAKHLLVPSNLYFDGLELFGYGDGNPASYNPFAVPSRSPEDPRPVVIPVPDWTDANDWMYQADPRIWPTIMMSYSANPGGGSHPMPELFSVVSPTAGLMFTNDSMPIKIRDEFAFGLATAKGIGKRIVA